METVNKKKEIAELFVLSDNLNICKLANVFNVSRQYVQQVLAAEVPNYEKKLKKIRDANKAAKATKKLELKGQHKNLRNSQNLDKMKEVSGLWISGESTEKIAAQMGWTQSSVSVRVSQWRAEHPDLFPKRIKSHH